MPGVYFQPPVGGRGNRGVVAWMAADEAVEQDALLDAFGGVLEHFWTLALSSRFPERTFRFERADGLFNEEGPCLTFCQER